MSNPENKTKNKSNSWDGRRALLVVALVLALGSGLFYRFLIVPKSNTEIALKRSVQELILGSLNTPAIQKNYTVHQTIELLNVVIIRLRPNDYAQQSDPVEYLFVTGLPEDLENKLLDPNFLNDTGNADMINFMVGQYLKIKSKGKTKQVELANIKAENTTHTLNTQRVLTGQTVLRIKKKDPKESKVLAVRGALIPWNLAAQSNNNRTESEKELLAKARIYLMVYRRAAYPVLDELSSLVEQLQK